MAQVYLPDEYAKIIFNKTHDTLAHFVKKAVQERFEKNGWIN